MPRCDGTGPRGQGPMTGRGMGFCVVRVNENQSQADPLAADNLSPDVKEFAGIQSRIISKKSKTGKEVSKMPGGDGTGPMGMGPMTGRAAGFCAGYGMPGYTNPIPGRGMGFGRGRGFWGRGRGGGRGFGRGWGGALYGVPAYGYGAAYGAPYAAPYAAPTKEQELGMLKDQAEQFESTLGDIRKRLQELETEKTAE